MALGPDGIKDDALGLGASSFPSERPMTDVGEVPIVLVGDHGTAERVEVELTRQSWVVQSGFALNDDRFELSGSRLVCSGVVADVDGLEMALMAAARGAGLVAVVGAKDSWAAASLADQLSVLGLDPRFEGFRAMDSAPCYDRDTAELLDRLASGCTIPDAAHACLLSLRTANRKLSAARKSLGVATTLELVVTHVRGR